VASEFRWTDWSAVLWDLDGVITATAEVHERAWAELFKEWDFSEADYLTYVDGRPRYDGVRAFLTSQGVSLPEGDPSDEPGSPTICGYGNRKNLLFQKIIDTEGVRSYRDTMAVVEFCATAGLRQAVVSSSRNAHKVLAAAGVTQHFEVVVDGLTAEQLSLPGKPDPAMFIHAASALATPIHQCVVVEDAVSGVKAGVASGAGWVLGVDRFRDGQDLLAAGADLVVSELSVTELDKGSHD